MWNFHLCPNPETSYLSWLANLATLDSRTVLRLRVKYPIPLVTCLGFSITSESTTSPPEVPPQDSPIIRKRASPDVTLGPVLTAFGSAGICENLAGRRPLPALELATGLATVSVGGLPNRSAERARVKCERLELLD